MNYFTPVEDGYAIIRNRGVYKQVALYTYKGALYAGFGTGFIGLFQSQNATTNPNVAWMELSIPTRVFNGRLTLA
jgi:hypothetical protein